MKFRRMKIEKFFGNRSNFENFPESENFSKIGGNLKEGGMHHGLRGMDAPACREWRTQRGEIRPWPLHPVWLYRLWPSLQRKINVRYWQTYKIGSS